MAGPPADPTQFAEAVSWFRDRIPMTDAEWDAALADEQAQAFKVAGVAEARVVQEVFDAIDAAIADGETLADFTERIGPQLEDAWGGADPPRIENVFRTNVLQAYSAGRDQVFDAPAVKEAFPYRQHRTVGDSRTCEICDPLDGTVLPADDPWWSSHRVPLHNSCRCEQVVLTHEEAHDEGVDDEPPESEDPPDGFGTRADVSGENWDPDWSVFDPEIAAIAQGRVQ